MKISVITATLNAMEYLPRLADSLAQQTDNDFEWIIADGGSTDGTLEYLNDFEGLDKTVLSETDFGIYDALNKAIKASKGDYYLILGADDFIYRETLAKYRAGALESGSDIVTAKILRNGDELSVKGGNTVTNNMNAYVSGHSVGSIFRTSLHDDFGMYVNKYPIAADYNFIKSACDGGVKVHKTDFVAGVFGVEGLSSIDVLGGLTENFRIQMKSKKSFIHILLLLFRLIKHYKKL